MNDTLKAAGRIGAELGAAKAEIEALREQVKVLQSDANSWQSGYDKGRHDGGKHRKSEVEQLRGLLREALAELLTMKAEIGFRGNTIAVIGRIDAALSQQPEPTDAYTAVDMATAAAQGFRDGQAAVEPAPAQDERTAFEAWFISKWPANQLYRRDALPASDPRYDEYCNPHVRHAYEGWLGRAASPAQTEQQPVEVMRFQLKHPDTGDAHAVALTRQEVADGMEDTLYEKLGDLICHCEPVGETNVVDCNCDEYIYEFELVNAAPIAQTAPQHPDDAAVDRFAAAMKAKLAKSRAKGRGGWDDPNVCSVEFLAQLLVEHLGKGNTGTFEDVANFAMMLHQRGADPKVLAEAAPQPEQSGKFAIGDRVKKTSGSEWVGHVCGTYSTPLTPEGYAVESEAHAGSVQIYPAKALEALE